MHKDKFLKFKECCKIKERIQETKIFKKKN